MILAVSYVICLVVSALLAGFPTRDTTLRRLAQATRISWMASGLAVLNLVVHTIDIPNDGLWRPAHWLFCSVLSMKIVANYRRRRDTKGNQIVAETARTLGIRGEAEDQVAGQSEHAKRYPEDQ